MEKNLLQGIAFAALLQQFYLLQRKKITGKAGDFIMPFFKCLPP